MKQDSQVDVDELELFAYQNKVCAVRTIKSKHSNSETWYQGIAYVPYKKKDFNQSNWYTKREDAIRMAEVMVRQANRS
jgi:hypothetical protein